MDADEGAHVYGDNSEDIAVVLLLLPAALRWRILSRNSSSFVPKHVYGSRRNNVDGLSIVGVSAFRIEIHADEADALAETSFYFFRFWVFSENTILLVERYCRNSSKGKS